MDTDNEKEKQGNQEYDFEQTQEGYVAEPTSIHQKIVGKIYSAFEKYVDDYQGTCIPLIAPVDVQLDCDDHTMVQPDILIVCDKNKQIYPWVVGAPDLIVEVVSPSNCAMDVIKKRYKYEKAGVREYWIVFPEKKIEVFLFEKNQVNQYCFEDFVPVDIWDGKCNIDFLAMNKVLQRITTST